MASSSEIMQALRNAHDSGNTKDAARLAQMYRDAKAKETKPSFADQAIDYGKKHGRELATLAGGTVGGLVAAPFAGLASIPTMGLGGVATEAAGVGLGAGIGGQAYDVLAQRMGWEKPQTPMQQVTNVVKDVAGNAIGVPVGRVVSAIAAPVVRSVAQSGGRALANALANPSAGKQLSRAGVQLTPGQMTGGALQRIEDASTSAPIAGDIIKSAQNRSVQTYNRVLLIRPLIHWAQGSLPILILVEREFPLPIKL